MNAVWNLHGFKEDYACEHLRTEFVNVCYISLPTATVYDSHHSNSGLHCSAPGSYWKEPQHNCSHTSWEAWVQHRFCKGTIDYFLTKNATNNCGSSFCYQQIETNDFVPPLENLENNVPELWISAEDVELLGSDEISCRGAGLKMYKVYDIIRNYTKFLAVFFHTFPYFSIRTSMVACRLQVPLPESLHSWSGLGSAWHRMRSTSDLQTLTS